MEKPSEIWITQHTNVIESRVTSQSSREVLTGNQTKGMQLLSAVVLITSP